MDNQINRDELVDFFKVLADPNRLKIVGLLAQHPLSVEQIAEMLNLHPSTVSHHLNRLSKVGLVSARPLGYYTEYRFEPKPLESMAQRLLSKETLPGVVDEIDANAYDRKVLKNYLTPEGRLIRFPSQQKKLEAVLRYVVQAFEPNVQYTEKQVNVILLRFSDDTASLRRDLIDFKLMDRQSGGSFYWRVDDEKSP